jgi:hypothetical protein
MIHCVGESGRNGRIVFWDKYKVGIRFFHLFREILQLLRDLSTLRVEMIGYKKEKCKDFAFEKVSLFVYKIRVSSRGNLSSSGSKTMMSCFRCLSRFKTKL